MLKLTNAGCQRNGKWLVRGVDMEIKRGEIITLIGPNGSGKSTTVKMALGILKPDEGRSEQQINLKIGYVPQKFSLDWSQPLRVKRFMRLTNSLSETELEKALELTSTRHLKSEFMHTLSGGELQRVLIARAIAREPDLLVLDEPVQGIDFGGEIELYELIKTVSDTLQCSVLMVSHDLHVVMAATDRVICLNGHVCCSGTPKMVATNPAYQTLFGARAAQALAVYQHAHDHEHLPDGRVKHADGSITDHCHPADGQHH